MYKILLATDGSEHAFKTIGKAAQLLKMLQGSVTVLSVVEDVPVYKGLGGLSARETELLHQSIEQVAREGLDKTKQTLAGNGIEANTLLRMGQAADVICEVVEEDGYDMVIVGDTGFGGIKELFLGSVSNKVAHKAKADVLIIKWMYQSIEGRPEI